jgi:myosin-crossreactive antigen
VNSVDYSPATSAEKPTNEQKTQDTAATPSTVTPTSSINITLSAAGQDSASGPVVVRTILDNTTGGSCTITLTKGSTVKTYSASITWQGTYYSCNKDIPYTDISAGEWQLKLVATQDSKQGTATKVISVNGG